MSQENAEPKDPTNLGDVQTFGKKRLAPGVYELPRYSEPDGVSFSVNGKDCGFLEAYYLLRDSRIKEIRAGRSVRHPDTYITEKGDLSVAGEWAALPLLRGFLQLELRGGSPFDAIWFPYGYDISHDADVSHTFFVVCDGKIVDEAFSFPDWEPLALERQQESELWPSRQHLDIALLRYWYRKFYTETVTGQLMVLRPDDPELYYFPEGRSKAGELIEAQLFEIRRVLRWVVIGVWALVALVGLQLILRWL
ncbi:MAG TPA: hypothetical protein VIW68_01395 [Candidatus Sulfotelmatobacter sp.]